VDVFFVISGFLITGWLLGRTSREGRVPFADFYAARARRILPAATLTLVATVIVSYLLLNPVRALAALSDVVWAAFSQPTTTSQRSGLTTLLGRPHLRPSSTIGR
jgi:peptidoglycan/LPS O-acetylase OafA/YrhL